MSVVQLVTVIGIPSMISGLFLLVVTRSLNRRDAVRKKADIETLKRVQVMKNLNEELEKQNQAIMMGVQALLRDRLLQGYKHYFNKGYADYEDRKNLENLYTQYHRLGSNGVMDDMHQRFIALPVHKEETEV